MREIKFRAWDGTKMTDAIRLTVAHGIRLSSTSELSLNRVSEDKVVLMQYTGLKDRNGKEIYEGDVVEYDYDVFTDERSMTERNLVRHVGADYGWLENMCNNGGLAVIGNVYENPELLKV